MTRAWDGPFLGRWMRVMPAGQFHYLYALRNGLVVTACGKTYEPRAFTSALGRGARACQGCSRSQQPPPGVRR